MENEEDIILDNNEEITRKDSRIKTLSDKVKLTSEERDEFAKAKEEAEAKANQNAKERDFYKGFNQVSAKYQGANEYQDKIWEKVQGGYDVEDATIAILAKEGKYTPTAPKQNSGMAAGGSATTSMQGNDSKAPSEMSQDERRSALAELEAKGEFHL